MYLRKDGPYVEIDAPAKLNLFLEVLGNRPDGYHELETLIIAINIFDKLTFTATQNEGIQFRPRWASARVATQRQDSDTTYSSLGDVPAGEDNLVVRAVRLLKQKSACTEGARIELIKRIPAAAGLGGASSDAAAALVAANHGWRLGWSHSQLAEAAAELGSDVPVFLTFGHVGRPSIAVCRGRGEDVTPVSGVAGLSLVIARPPVGLSTAKVYRQCQPATHKASMEPLLEALACGNTSAVGATMFNALQKPAEELTPWVSRLKEHFSRLSFVGHQLSGSGTAYFGLCRNARQARSLAGYLRSQQIGHVWQAQSC